MWQTKQALAIPKNLGVDFWPCIEGDFLTVRPQSVVQAVHAFHLTQTFICMSGKYGNTASEYVQRIYDTTSSRALHEKNKILSLLLTRRTTLCPFSLPINLHSILGNGSNEWALNSCKTICLIGILLVRNPIGILTIQLGKFRLFKIDISKIINFDSCIGFKV